MDRWTDHVIFWHVYPLGFAGAPMLPEHRSAEPRLRKLLNWLDYAVELGASGLLLGPIFQSNTHGYDTTDYFTIDDRLGTEKDFDDLLAACKERGIRVVLDGVFSHVAWNHPMLEQALREGRDSEFGQDFDIEWDADGGPRARVFEGHGSLARFNHAGEGPVNLAQDVMKHWLGKGIDGWRLDAAYSVGNEFWAKVLPAVREDFPDAWIVGEVIHGDYAGFVQASGADSVTQYELWKAIWSSLKDENFYELDWNLKRHNEFLDTFIPQTFVGNHDVTRIATMVGSEKAILALAVLMTVGGIPSIYYGDEQGYTGLKEEREGGDDQIRPLFPESPDQMSGLGAVAHRAHQALIGVRRRNPWLVRARTEVKEIANQHLLFRAFDGDSWLETELHLDGTPRAQVRDAGGVLWESES